MMISGAWTLTNLAASSSEEQMKDIEVTTLPAIPGGKAKLTPSPAELAAVWPLAVERKGKRKNWRSN